MSSLNRRKVVGLIGMSPFAGGLLTRVRASDGASLGTFAVGNGAAGITYDGTMLSLANSSDNTLMRLRPSDGAVIAVYATGAHPFGVVYDGQKIWVANAGSNSVSTATP